MNGESETKSGSVFHFVHMRGLGGVQVAFDNTVVALEKRTTARLSHYVISPRGCDACYAASKRLTSGAAQIASALRYLAIRSRQTSISHFHNLLKSRNILRINKNLPSGRIILHEHGAAWNAGTGDSVLRQNAALADTILCNSKASAALLREKFQLGGQRFEIVLNGIHDMADPVPARTAMREPRCEFTVGFFGRIEANKGLHVLLKAFSNMSTGLKSNARLVIFGEGALKGPLESRFDGDPRIDFRGRTNQVREEMAKIDVIVVPSIREPFGNVVAEAGLLGIPVIAANIDGIPEALGQPANAVLLEPTAEIEAEYIEGSAVPLPELVYYPSRDCLGAPRQVDQDELCAALEDVMDRYPVHQEKAARLQRFVRENLSVQAYADRVAKVYFSLL